MALPLARSNAEAHIYMDLHACVCGSVELGRASSVVLIDGELASRYTGDCAGCGRPIEFTFRLPETTLVPVGDEVTFGGPEPSELIDAGEWLSVADLYARSVPARPSADELDAARLRMATAIAALDEVLRFAEPGRSRIAESALFSDRGRAVYAEEPGRFDIGRLTAVRDAYRTWLRSA